ncbi:MAG: hypothetical protein M3Q63_01975 [bacterium]|nr:hypothetical protein [bacterium]
MMNTPLFYIALFIHIVSFITAFGAVIGIDFAGTLWMLKKIPLKTVSTIASVTQKLIWIGWIGLVLSGIVLIYHKGFIDELTWIKLFFVAMLGLNGIFLHFIKKSTDALGDVNELPAKIIFRTALASTISQLGWWGAITIGFVHRHIEHYIPYPPHPWPLLIMIIILITICVAALIGESVTNKKVS